MPSASGKSRTFGLPEAIGMPTLGGQSGGRRDLHQWMAKPENEIEIYNTLGDLPPRLSVLKQLNKEGKLFAGDKLLAQAKTAEPLFKQGTPGWYPEFSSAVARRHQPARRRGRYRCRKAVAQMADRAEKAKNR